MCEQETLLIYGGGEKTIYRKPQKATHVQNMCINFDQSKNEICYSIKFSIEIYINVF